jgi:DNA polymerase-3 subunit epsilon
MREIALDTESTGFDEKGGDRLVEIGCVELVDGRRTGDTYHVYINPERLIPADAQKVHGITDEFVKDKAKFREIADKFLAYIGDDRLIIHNAEFDVRFLNFELARCGKPPIKNEVLDTLIQSRRKWPGKAASLDALCSRLGVDNTDRTLHGALIDAALLADVYSKMYGLDGLGLGALGEGKEAALEAAAPAPVPGIARKQRPVRDILWPTPEEHALHEAFFAGITGSVWPAILAE